jgi:hypothetical protein
MTGGPHIIPVSQIWEQVGSRSCLRVAAEDPARESDSLPGMASLDAMVGLRRLSTCRRSQRGSGRTALVHLEPTTRSFGKSFSNAIVYIAFTGPQFFKLYVGQ